MQSVPLATSASNAQPALPPRQDQRPADHTNSTFASLLDMNAPSPDQPPPPPPPAPPARADAGAPPSNTAADNTAAKPADPQQNQAGDSTPSANNQAAPSAGDSPAPAPANTQGNGDQKTTADQTGDDKKDQSKDKTTAKAGDTAGATDPSQILAGQATASTPSATAAATSSTAAATPIVALVPVVVADPNTTAATAAVTDATSAPAQATAIAAVGAATKVTTPTTPTTTAPTQKATAAQPDATVQPQATIAATDTIATLAQPVAKQTAGKPAPATTGATAAAKDSAPEEAPEQIPGVAHDKAEAAPVDKAHLEAAAAAKITHTSGKADIAADPNLAASAANAADGAPDATSNFNAALQGNPVAPSTTTVTAASTTQGGPDSTSVATVPIEGLAVEIASRAKDGAHSFDIRLDPPELGKIHVKLDVDSQGNVSSSLVVERQDTLDLLRRDFTGLERALNDAGFKTSDSGLQFSLRDQSAGGGGDGWRQQQGQSARIIMPINDTAVAANVARYQAARLGGVDISV